MPAAQTYNLPPAERLIAEPIQPLVLTSSRRHPTGSLETMPSGCAHHGSKTRIPEVNQMLGGLPVPALSHMAGEPCSTSVTPDPQYTERFPPAVTAPAKRLGRCGEIGALAQSTRRSHQRRGMRKSVPTWTFIP